MKNFVTRLVAASVLVACASGVSAATIVTNGSFESGLTGWTQTGSGTTPGINITVLTTGGTNTTGYGDNVANYDGTHAAFFVDDNANEDLKQNVTLGANTNYTVSFALYATGSGAGNPNLFTLKDSLGASLISSLNNSAIPVGTWTAYSYSFTSGSAGSYLLDFNFKSGSTPAKDVLLDAVAINAVPEPASWALMLIGFGSLGLAMRRRKVAVQFA